MRGFGWVFVVGLYASSADQNVESVVSCQEVNHMIASDGHLFACDSQQFGNRPITTTKSTPWATRRVQRQCLQIYQTPLFGGTQYRWWCVLPLLTTIHFNCSNSLKLTLALDSLWIPAKHCKLQSCLHAAMNASLEPALRNTADH
jgi:hypothetical protein